MANTLNDLYLKFFQKNAATIEKDRYFQYLFALAQVGDRTIVQNNKTLHKCVDEDWLSVIEESLDSLNTITDNPRRFVTTREEVVPASLAKRISSESVMHLVQNTQFIAAVKGDEVIPDKILNISSEDSYNLYENRFVYYLIQRLVTFIDKRTDLIFWQTGDETMDTLTLESKIDDAYETIEYKLEMKIKNQQSAMENDSDNMQTFMRIDRVRRLVMRLRSSPFCAIMAGCQAVRSPIQRTNLLMKDPDYRTCYKLWQFLESYDKVGYTIEEIDRPLEFDEEYLNQLQTGMIANYALFKSILDEDKRNPTEQQPKRRRVAKPKFLKRIQEEIVDNYNIEDVEVRKVFIKEVTEAQEEAEAKLAEMTERAERAEQERAEIEAQAGEAISRMQFAMDQLEVAETAMHAAVKAREEAEKTVAKVVYDSQISIQNAEAARAAAEKESEINLNARHDMEVSLREAKAARKTAEEELAKAQSEREAAETQMLADRTRRETAEKHEIQALHDLEEIRVKNEELNEETKKAKELYWNEATARIEADKARAAAESEIEGAIRKKELAEEESRQAKEAAKKSAENAKSFERARNSAEFRLKAAQETIEKVTQERKTAQQHVKRSREELEATEAFIRELTAQRDDESTKRTTLEQELVKTQSEMVRFKEVKHNLEKCEAERTKALADCGALEQELTILRSQLEIEKAARQKAEKIAAARSLFRRNRRNQDDQ